MKPYTMGGHVREIKLAIYDLFTYFSADNVTNQGTCAVSACAVSV